MKKNSLSKSKKKKLKDKSNTKKLSDSNLENFKRIVGKKIKNIDWLSLGTLSLAVLIVLGIKGVFGPKAQGIAIVLAKTIIV